MKKYIVITTAGTDDCEVRADKVVIGAEGEVSFFQESKLVAYFREYVGFYDSEA